MNKISIIITDDHTLIRQTWKFLLHTDPRFEVVAEAGSGEEAIELVRQFRPNVVLMDINLPGIDGTEATQEIRKISPGTKVLGVSMFTQPVYVRKILKKGASGYVTKNSSCEEMFTAIIEVTSGRKYLCEEIKTILSQHVIYGDDESATGFNSLSAREIEIIGFVRKGHSSKEIASSLSVSVKTIDVHRYNILKKLNMKNTAAMVNFINSSQLASNF